jgi:uncharacterized protein YecE (DUF72 family)
MFHVGCQGWAYTDWVTGPADTPVFYPRATRNEEMLEIYARAFSTVEVDSTFYAIPSVASVDAWVKRTPPGFRFALKFPQEVTHKLMFRGESVAILDEFCDRVRVLDKKLACVLIQTPPFLDGAIENFRALGEFLAHLPDDISFAIEFRNRDWIDNHVIDLLGKYGVAFSLVHGQWLRDSDIRWIAANPTAQFTYIRWMGERDLTRFDTVQRPQDENLKRWARLMEYLTPVFKDQYAYFSNFYEGHSPVSANKLKVLLGQPVLNPIDLDDQPSLFS